MRAGDLQRPYRGVRRSSAARSGEDRETADDRYRRAAGELSDRCAAFVTVMSDDAFFCHLTAARVWPLPLPSALVVDGQPLHVAARPPRHPPRRAGIVGHQISDARTTVVSRGGYRLIDGASLFCQLGAVLRTADLVAIGDSLVMTPRFAAVLDPRPWVTLPDLQERVDAFRGRGKTRAVEALGLIRPGAESRPESLLRLAIVGDGMPEPELNGPVVDEAGALIGWVDMLYRAFRTIIEYDGDQHRIDVAQYDKDVHRLETLTTAGWRVVRVTARDLFGNRGSCLARIRQALIAGGWRP